MLVLHYTGMADGPAALARLTDFPEAKVSAHYGIDRGGWPGLCPCPRGALGAPGTAGKSAWRGHTDINAASIGVEIVNPGHEFGYRPFPEPQIASAIELLADIRSRWTIPDERILAHSDVAPDRKTDPGELFPWKRLAEAGHGLWVEPAPAPGAPLAEGDEGLGVLALQAALGRLGYDSPRSGRYEADLAVDRTGFPASCWRPGRADGDRRMARRGRA